MCEFCAGVRNAGCVVCGSAGVAVADDLAALDGSLAADAEALASGAVREFAERVETDVAYALLQLRRGIHMGLVPSRDCMSRAIDALERIEGRCAGV